MDSIQTDIQRAPKLNDGLRVRDIANFSLKTCAEGDDSQWVLNRDDLREYDQIPVKRGDSIVGVLERSAGQPRSLDESILVSADESLATFIYKLRPQQSYRLVVDGTAITGIVTWSDLLKPPVLLLGYSLVAQLEISVNRAIQMQYGDSDDWLALLEKDDAKAIRIRKQWAEKENLSLPLVEVADLVHKAKAVRHLLSVERSFASDLENVRKFRNAVAHVHRFMRTNADLSTFVCRLDTVTSWLRALENAERLLPVARD